MISYKKAQEIINKNINQVEKSELINLEECISRVLSKDYKAKKNSPEFDKSSMDGVVIQKKDLNKKKRFKIVGESKAGDVSSKEIKSGEAKLIFTGAPIPNGTKKIVIIKEYIETIDKKFVTITKNIKSAISNIRSKGIDYKKGEVCLKKNSVLNSRSLSLAYALNLDKLKVIKKPKVAIIITGNEIENSSNPYGNINSSNSITISNLVNFFGGKIIDLQYSSDSIKDIQNSFDHLHNYDLLITSGGLSAGKYDLVKKALNERKLKLLFEKVAMKPGKPCAFGLMKNNKYFVGLPGNPVSCFIGMLTFVNQIIKRLLGIYDKDIFNFCRATSEKDIPKNNNLTSFLRIKVRERESSKYFQILKDQDSSLLSVLSDADGIIIRFPYESEIKKGNQVNIIQFKNFENFII